MAIQMIADVPNGTMGLQEARVASSILSRGALGVVSGSLPRFLSVGGPEPSDLDMFPRTEVTYQTIYEALKVFYGEPKDQPNSVVFDTGGLPINLVKAKEDYTSNTAIVDMFDFHVCQFWLDGGGMIGWTPEAMTAHENNVLSLHKITCALGTMARVVKYAKKGYRVPALVLFELFENYHEDYERYSQVRESLDSEDADAEALAEMYTLMFLD